MDILTEVSEEVFKNTMNYAAFKGVLRQNISEWNSIMFVFAKGAESYPEMIIRTHDGFRIRMISSETENEKDPIFDIFDIVLLKDVFWVKHIIENALYALAEKKD